MRLSKLEISTIKDAIQDKDAKAKIHLFGSRTDDSKRGGDIDLLVISDVLEDDDKWEILDTLYSKIGEQKIDILITDKTNIQKEPFLKIAYDQGIEL